MADKIRADASPEKRLFISLITRDISLIDAFLDIIDNSINAALEPLAPQLKTADGYQRLLANRRLKPRVQIDLTIGTNRITVEDTAGGISADMASKHVFKFGRSAEDADSNDRLSVYGIGLKRAIFKCGNKIEITSENAKGGFELDLTVSDWAKKKLKKDEPWTFEITPRAATRKDLGTRITITQLYDDVVRRLADGLFEGQLRERIARTYSFFIGRVVEISLNGKPIPKEVFDIGQNYSSHKFKSGTVTCNITAGMARSPGKDFRDKNSGWFVFCNGRAVLFADKTRLTGWTGGGTGLPLFQPKHRPFLGTVFFVSADPEALPWTTTKASVNEESAVWQEAKRHMISVGRVVTSFLDNRYTEEGTEFAPADLQDATGKSVSVLAAAVGKAREFKPPKKEGSNAIRIQYSAKLKDVKMIESYLRRPGMGGSEVGRYTFNYFLKNEVR
ncbi:MAG TPA: ATP-binding protein [Rhizomicrobium sp.]